MDETELESPQVRTIFEAVYDVFANPANWEALFINFVAGVVILLLTYLGVERWIDWRKEAARKKLFKRLVRETLSIASCCERLVSHREEATDVHAPVLNDRFLSNVELAYISTFQFNEQLAIYSGNLDHRKVEQLSKISSIVSHLRSALNSIRQYDEKFIAGLEFYAPDDPSDEYASISPQSFVPASQFRTYDETEFGVPYKLFTGLEQNDLDRDENWRLFFVIACHDILWNATLATLHTENFATSFKYSMQQVEAELLSERLTTHEVSVQREKIEEKRRAIVEDGLYLVQYVIRPGTVTRKAAL
ncbi:MAG: hypothetical protein AAGI36_17175 [Pseudomonadota bacterium]